MFMCGEPKKKPSPERLGEEREGPLRPAKAGAPPSLIYEPLAPLEPEAPDGAAPNRSELIQVNRFSLL